MPSTFDTVKRSIAPVSWSDPLSTTSFDAAGLIALADLNTIAKRTALTGTANYFDALILCPGLHRQQKAPDLNNGEFPATAALTSGYVFRVENQATVAYLQSVGIPGHLLTLNVESIPSRRIHEIWTKVFGPNDSVPAFFLLMTIRAMTIASLLLMGFMHDWWGLSLFLALILARLLNIIVIRRRASLNWHGALEPGVQGDLLILVSQDRWLRLKGSVDSLKAVTSGQWLRDMTFFENSLNASATMLVYVSAALVSNATQAGKLIFIALLLLSVAFLAVSNEQAKALYMHGNVIKPKGSPKLYARRLDLAKDLIAETKRDDWAIGLGMIKASDSKTGASSGKVTL